MLSLPCASVFLLETWVMKILTCLLGSGWEWNELIHVRGSRQSSSHSTCTIDAAVAGDGGNKTELGFLDSSTCANASRLVLMQR